ncbi:hypothetical protein PR002_g24238 [Phytophthora rubi]|uniref:Uncharacterized protein n=1 Tax=Phytophthora rubi TaxID=129364 RepID=A0A6A3ICI3_9STRA|nr:hypothetical protein PR002_g24238 [Phytophthora rubi]
MARIVSCRFLRLSCREEDHPLFRREYARSNRERGVKLLRCFPHCCPEHARRSYCGCSVHVLVTFESSVSAAELDELMVLGVGESVALPASLFSPSGRRSSMESVWIRADRESDARQRAFPKNSVLYVVNNCRFPKWYYSYDSSTTPVQRDMTHRFVAYVLQLSGGASKLQQYQPQQQQEVQLALCQHPEKPRTGQRAVVLASHASPSFLLISFRRSGSAIVAGNAAAALSAASRLRDNVKPTTSSKVAPLAFVSADRDSE